MTRIGVNPQTLFISVPEVYEMIEKDIVENASEIYGRQEYYTHKYRGDLINDVNVGVYIDDDLRVAVQIYVSNGQSKLRTKLKLSQNLQRVSDQEILNKQNMIIVKEVPVYAEGAFNERLDAIKAKLIEDHKDFTLEEVVVGYPKDGNYIVQFHML